MVFIEKLLILILGIVAGILMMKYRVKIVGMVGKNYYAERYLGAGGTYTLWVLIGAIVVVGSIYYVLK